MPVTKADKKGFCRIATRSAICLFLVGFIYPILSAANGFQQDASGVVSMEAEHYQGSVVSADGHEWLSAGGTYGGYSGTDALQALPSNEVVYTTGYASLSPRLDYTVNFTQARTYYVWARAWGPTTSSNSLHVGLDGQEVSTSSNMRLPDNQTSRYVWVSTISGGGRSSFNVNAAGVHTVNVWMRESGTVVDKVVLTPDATFNPSALNGGLGPDETLQSNPGGADLSVAVSVDTASPQEGDTIVYTVQVTDNGPSDATGVSLSDVLPAGLSYVGNDAASSGTFYDSATGEWTVGNLSNAATATLHITATVNSGTSGSMLTNTASVSGLNQGDPVSTNDSASVAVSVVTAGGGGGVGGSFQQDASGVVSMEAEHYQGSVVSADGHEWLSAGGTYGGYSGTDALQALPSNEVVYTTGYASLSPRLDYTVNFTQARTYYVWARAWGPTTSSNSLHVGLDGQEVSTSSNMRLPDNQTSRYVWVSTISGGGRSSFNVNAAGVHTVNVWMRESGTVVDKVVLTPDATFNPSALNGGLGPDETLQSNPGGADLSVAVSVDTASPQEGDTIVYTVQVTDNGPSDATGVSLSDVLPAGLSYVGNDAASSGTFYDSATGEWTVGNLSNAATATLHITATVNSGTSGSMLTNTASVSGLNQGDPVSTNDSASVAVSVVTAGGGGGVGGSFQQDASGVVSMEAEHYQGSVVSADGHEWLSAGGTYGGYSGTDALAAEPNNGARVDNFVGNSPRLDYTVNFTQAGTYYVWVRGMGPTGNDDSLHVGLDGAAQSSSDRIAGFPNSTTWAWRAITMDGPVATINVASAGVHTVNVWMREDGFVFDKLVLTPDATFNPSALNGGLGPDETLQSNPGGADLSVAVSVDTASPQEGDTIVYTVQVTDNGPSDATGVSLSDVLPAGLSYVGNDAASSGTFYDSATGEWTVGNLSNAATATLHITATVNSGTSGSMLTNTASVSGLNQGDPVSTNDSASVAVSVVTAGGGGGVGGSFQQDASGVVSMEAEHYQGSVVSADGHEWLSAGGTYGGYSGTDALAAEPNNGARVDNFVGNSPRLDYTVNFTQAGTYYVWVRGMGPTGNDDSLHVGLDGAAQSSSDRIAGFPNSTTWAWRAITMDGPVATINVASAGVHTVNVWMREDGFVFDKLVLTPDATFNPSALNGGLGPDESGGGGPLPAGLVDYWRLDESSGSSYANVVNGRPSASCTGCPAPIAGRIGGGQQFDGVTDEVNVADDNSFDWSNGERFSIEAWIKHGSSCSVTGESVVGRRDAASQLLWSLGCQGSNATFTLIDTTGAGAGADLVGTTDITDGQWHHVVAMRDAISGKNYLYVDGAEDASASVSYAGNFGGVTSLNIGWLNQSGSDYHFAGVIDEVALHDRVLPDSEIRRHYADGTVGLQRGYWGCGAPVRIMPLGDSITNAWNPGYRPGLYFDLLYAGMDVDMVGSLTDPCAPNCSHDPNHEGHSGYTATDIASNITTWLGLNPPDVVTLHIGTNVDASFPYPDVTQVGAILDAIKGYDADIPVVLARIINKARSSYDPQLSVYNQNLEAMAQARIAVGDRLLVVDQEPGLDYSASTTDFNISDDKHPTASGSAKMVPVWFKGLNRFMPACDRVIPLVISSAVTTASSGVPYVYVVEATGVPAPSFSLTGAPSGMTIHPDTGRIAWLPPSAGNYGVTVQVSNSEGSSVQGFTISVN